MDSMYSTSLENQLFKSKYDNVLLQNEISTARWSNFKDEHDKLKSRLISFRDKLKHDVMVPVGKLALFKGKLVHTNEILVSLGDGWFAKRSVAEATEICDRRIKYCDEMLAKLLKERELFSNRTYLPQQYDLFSQDEIVEPYNEENELLWRERHKARMKAYKQEEARERLKCKAEDKKDMFELLDALEAQEKLGDEMNKLELGVINDIEELDSNEDDDEEDDYDEEDDDDDEEDDDDDEDEEDYDEDDDIPENNVNEKKVMTVKPGEILNSVTEERIKTDISTKGRNYERSRKVSFANATNEEEEIEPIYIKFKHSNVLPRAISSQEINNRIVSPSDILKTFAQSLTAPKSILKRSISVPLDIKEDIIKRGDAEVQIKESDLDKLRSRRSEMAVPVKIGDVVERSHVSLPTTEQSSRPVSRFKAARQAKK